MLLYDQVLPLDAVRVLLAGHQAVEGVLPGQWVPGGHPGQLGEEEGGGGEAAEAGHLAGRIRAASKTG